MDLSMCPARGILDSVKLWAYTVGGRVLCIQTDTQRHCGFSDP